MIQKTNVTYGRLDKVLRSFGFSRRIFENHGKGVRYEHKDTGAEFSLPLLPAKKNVMPHHLVMIRAMLDGFGVADPAVFEKKLQKTG